MFAGTVILIVGLVVGSFLNVVIYRLPRGESFVFPASHCPHCQTQLKWYDLIPVVSYLFLKGRCRYCGEKISIRYPFVELITGTLFLAVYLKFSAATTILIYLLLTSMIIVISFIDLEYQIIPNQITYPGIILGLILSIFFNHINFLSALIGGLIPGLLLFLIAAIYRKGMGMGDVKLAAMLGVFLGWKYTLMGIFLGSLLGSIFGILLMVLGKFDRKTRVPFAPLISVGILINLFWGDFLLNFYLTVFQ